MTAQQRNFDRVLAEVIEADGPQAAPSSFIDASITAARATGQRRLLVPALDTRAWPARGALGSTRPLGRTTRLALVAALVAVVATSAVAVGMKLFEQPVSPLRVTTLVPVGTLTNSFDYAITLVLPDGRLLVGGSAQTLAELFDPVTGVATPIQSGATSGVLQAANLLPDGRVFLVAWGSVDDGTGGDSRAWLLDPATGTLSASIRTLETRWGAATALLPDGRVLVLGGNSDLESGVTRKTTEVFDPAAMRFLAGPDLAAPRMDGLVAATTGGKVLVVGGFEMTGPDVTGWVSQIELFDPDSGVSRVVGDLVGPSGPGAYRATRMRLVAMPDGRLLIFGRQIGPKLCGRDGIDPVSVQLFDPATGTVTDAAPVAHGITAAVAMVDGRAAVAGSWTAIPNGCWSGAESISNDWLGVYDPASGLVAETRNPITGTSSLDITVAHRYAGGALLPDGRVALVSAGPQAASIDIITFPAP